MDKLFIAGMENLGGRADRTLRDIEHFGGFGLADAVVRQICRAYLVLVIAGNHVRQLGRDRCALPFAEMTAMLGSKVSPGPGHQACAARPATNAGFARITLRPRPPSKAGFPRIARPGPDGVVPADSIP